MKTTIAIVLTLIGIIAIAMGVKSMTKQTWDKTFPQNENVTVEKVKFKNRLAFFSVIIEIFDKLESFSIRRFVHNISWNFAI